MPQPETMRVKAHVRIAGLQPGQVGDVRLGYAKQLIKVGYASPVENLAEALSAEPTRYGDWTDDPRSSNDDAEGDGLPEDDSFPEGS